MKAMRYLFTLIMCAGLSTAVFAQQPVNTTMSPGGAPAQQQNAEVPPDIYERENIIPEKKPVPYAHIREADVMWAKDLWRIIDLRERMNYPLRYPEIEPIGNRYSLYLLLMEGIRSEELTPYAFKDNFNNPFSQPTTLKQIYQTIGADTIFGDNGEVLRIDVRGPYIKQVYVKEKWFFDKQHSEMKVRIVALAPVIVQNKTTQDGQVLPEIEKIIPFFVSYPQCRRIFATHPVFNPKNDAQRISFDDLFFQRRFSSVIAAESNVHGNRFILDYLTGQDALMEAREIKQELFRMEHDLWEY